jgi:RNA methyltransferase, TrmH family
MKYISSPDNPGLKQLARLQKQATAYRDEGAFLCEGAHLWNEWLAHGQERFALRALYVNDAAAVRFQSYQALTHEVPHTLLERYASGASKQHVLFLLEHASQNLLPSSGPSSVNAVLLDTIQDAGNVGSILRSAAGIGVQQVLLRASAAAYSPKVIRAARGAHFVLSVEDSQAADCFAAMQTGTWLAAMVEQSESLFEAKFAAPVNWIFGNEGQGISPEIAARAAQRIRIPQQGPQSLNVAAAAAVCLFESARRLQASNDAV